MATMPGAAVATPVVSDIMPPKVPSSQPPLIHSPRPSSSSQPQSPQLGGSTNKGMAAHHRILALNRAWEEKRKKRSGGFVGDWDSDSSDTESESDGGDIVIPPKRQVGPQPQATQAAQAAPISSPLPRQPSQQPVDVPAQRVPPSNPIQTPVPLPAYTKIRSDQRSGHKESSTLRTQARRFTEDSALKAFTQAKSMSDPQDLAGTGKASAMPPAKNPKGNRGRSPKSGMHFATPGELLARIRRAAPASPGALAPPPVPPASAPALLPSGKGDEFDCSSPDEFSATEGTDDNDLMILDEAPPGFEGVQPAAPTEKPLRKNVEGKSYNLMQHPNAPAEPGRGTIFPTGYKLHAPPLQYICPVRDCRRLMKNMTALGGHFTAAHKGGKFNDNHDGTFSLVGTYKNPTGGYSPGIVVSQNPLPLDAEPPAEPSRPPWSMKRNSDPVARRPNYVQGSSGVFLSAEPAQGTDDVAAYLHSFLPNQTMPSRLDIRLMEKLPRLRDLPASWIKYHRNTHLPMALYASALAYLTGDVVTGGACGRGSTTSRLSYPCIALPSSLPAYAVKEFAKVSTCVGCHYYSHLHRQRNACDWAGDAVSPGSKSITPVLSSEREDVETREATKRTPTLASTREPRKRSAPALNYGVGPAAKVAKVSAESAESAARGDSVELDEMEPWEFAPGRLTDDTGSENVAFSGAYLTSAQPITVFQDVSINVIVVKPGGSNRWPAEMAKLRTCTVATGKVRVKVADRAFFQVGPNGAFILRPGETALVENRCYGDATIHCVTVKDYELSG